MSLMTPPPMLLSKPALPKAPSRKRGAAAMSTNKNDAPSSSTDTTTMPEANAATTAPPAAHKRPKTSTIQDFFRPTTPAPSVVSTAIATSTETPAVADDSTTVVAAAAAPTKRRVHRKKIPAGASTATIAPISAGVDTNQADAVAAVAAVGGTELDAMLSLPAATLPASAAADKKPRRSGTGGSGVESAATRLRNQKLAALRNDMVLPSTSGSGAGPRRPNIVLHLKCTRRDLQTSSMDTFIDVAAGDDAWADAGELGADRNASNSATHGSLAMLKLRSAAVGEGEDLPAVPETSAQTKADATAAFAAEMLQRQRIAEREYDRMVLNKKLAMLETCLQSTGALRGSQHPMDSTATASACTLVPPMFGGDGGGANLAASSIPLPAFCTSYPNPPKCSCFWDSCEFDTAPVYIPKAMTKTSIHVYGCFCSPECAVAYLTTERIDASIRVERMAWMNVVYGKMYGYTRAIKPAPSPHYMLSKFMGNLSVAEYRSLFQHDRLFTFVEKPMSFLTPAMFKDADDFEVQQSHLIFRRGDRLRGGGDGGTHGHSGAMESSAAHSKSNVAVIHAITSGGGREVVRVR